MVKTGMRSLGFDVVRFDESKRRLPFDVRFGLNVLDLVVRELMRARSAGSLTLLQIGANDGVQQDPVRPILVDSGMPALLVEPLPETYRQLVANYAEFAAVQCLNCAVGAADGNITLYALDSEQAQEKSLVASFDRDHVQRFAKMWGLPADSVVSVEVPCLTVASILARGGMASANIAVVDTEGLDHIICHQLLDLAVPPEVLHFEYANSPEHEVRRLLSRLEDMRYAVARSGLDITATTTMPVVG